MQTLYLRFEHVCVEFALSDFLFKLQILRDEQLFLAVDLLYQILLVGDHIFELFMKLLNFGLFANKGNLRLLVELVFVVGELTDLKPQRFNLLRLLGYGDQC